VEGTAMMKSTIITKKCEGETSEMEELLHYKYIFGSCLCDVRYDERYKRGRNPT
jgi:hypothetical protein